jgi:hypothetical protein
VDLPRKTVIRLGRVTISLLLLAIVYRRIDLSELRSLLSSARAELLFIAICQLYLNTALSAYKWGLFLRADGIHIPFFKLLNSYLVGSFMNLFLPSNIGGDAYRVIDIGRRSRRTASTFTSVLADRLSGLVALVMLGTGFGLLSLRLLPERDIILIPLAAMLLLAVMIALLFQEGVIRSILVRIAPCRSGKLWGFADALFESIAKYRRAPGLLSQVMAISFFFQFNVVLAIFVLSRALKLEIPFLYFCVFVPIISIIEAIPITIYGLGLRDASYLLFFTRIGVARVDALAIALGYVILTLTYSLLGGLILLWRELKWPAPATSNTRMVILKDSSSRATAGQAPSTVDTKPG